MNTDQTKTWAQTSVETPVTPSEARRAGNAKTVVNIGPHVQAINKLLKEKINDTNLSYTWSAPATVNYETSKAIAEAFRAQGWRVDVVNGSQYNETYCSITFKAG